jgi:hypothetical protein
MEEVSVNTSPHWVVYPVTSRQQHYKFLPGGGSHFKTNKPLMHKKHVTKILLLCSILLCLLLPAAHAQYGLGLTRQQVKKMIKKQYRGQGAKPVFTEEMNRIIISATDSAGTTDNFVYYFNRNDSCWRYQKIFTSDAARQKVVQQILSNAEEGWQKVNRYFYLSSFEKQINLTIFGDTPLYNFSINVNKWTRDDYDTLISFGKRLPDSIDTMPDKSLAVVWQMGTKLQPQHFYSKGEHGPPLKPYISNMLCNLYCNIGSNTNTTDSAGSLPVSIYAAMLPAYSWAFLYELENDTILAYKQLHFDIAELVARQLRRDLSQVILPRAKYRQKIKQMLDAAAVTLSKLQQQYDDAVKHNPGSPQMAFWQQNIAQKLTELNPYTKHTVEVDIR